MIHRHWHKVPKSSSHIWGFVFTRTYSWDDVTGWQLIFGLGRLQLFTISKKAKA